MHSHDIRGGGGTRLHVTETGPQSGRPILFVNGYSTSGLGWIHQLRSDLADDFRLVALDTRGHGRSEKPKGGYDDPTLWADDVQSVIDSLDLDAPVLVASSLAGVHVAHYLAVHGTDDVAGLNMVGAVTTLGTEESMAQTGSDFLELIPALESEDAAENVAAVDELWRRIPHEPLPTRDHYYMVGITVQTPPHVRRSVIRQTVAYDDLYPTVDTPVLLTHGDEDTIILPEAAEQQADAFPDAELSVYEGVGHAPLLETPGRFNDELRAFVSSL